MTKTLFAILPSLRRSFLNGVALLSLLVSSALAAAAAEPAPASSSGTAAIHVVALQASPLMLKTPEGERGVVSLQFAGAATAKLPVTVLCAAWPAQKPTVLKNLPAGTNAVELSVPILTEAVEVKVRFELPGGPQEFGPFKLTPPRRWTIYLTQHTHTDIGYTRPQTEILPEHLRYIDYALDYCDLTDRLPDDARFRWTCETAWAVREYLQRRPAAQIARLKQRVQEGRIEIAGMLLNMSDIATENSLAASLQPLRALKEVLGVTVRTALQNDVNGAAWCLVDYFNDIGIRYLSMGINQTRSILPFDQPTAFWWESPSGKRVLAYRSDHYMTANFWGIEKGELAKFKPGALGYLRSLEDRKYPFDHVGVQFSGYFTDNSPPSTIACDLVREWNETYAWPRLRLSTAQEFLSYVEQEHGKELAVHRQAWPDWWTDGFGSAARETAAARETETAMQVTQGLLAMASILGADIRPGLLERIAGVQDNLLFYAEHTYGAAESVDDPLAENTQVQWGEKASYVWNAVKESNLLREEAFGLLQDFLPRAEVPTLAVFNTLNWQRSGLVRVFIDHEILPSDCAFRIVDAAAGTAVPAQAMDRRAEGTYWALWVKDVPPLGYRILRLEAGKDKRAPEPRAPESLSLENAFYSLTIDPARGAVKSLVDKQTGQELVDPGAAWGLGQCVYETLVDRNQMAPKIAARTSLRDVKVQPGANGPIWKSLLVTGNLDGCATNGGLKAELRLYETEKRVELHFAARKLPIRKPEGLYVAFPFRSPEAKMLYEVAGGSVTPGNEQIPGSASDWQTFQNFISVRGAESQIIWGSEGAPLVQLGDFNLGKWQRVARVDRPHVYSWVMNNYWFTNFRVEQEGELRWSYYLTSTRDLTRSAAARFGWGSRVQLATRVLPPSPGAKSDRPWTLSTFDVKLPNALLVEARPLGSGEGVLLHLRETDGKPFAVSEADIESPFPVAEAAMVNVLGEVLRGGIESHSQAPFESRFLVLKFRQP